MFGDQGIQAAGGQPKQSCCLRHRQQQTLCVTLGDGHTGIDLLETPMHSAERITRWTPCTRCCRYRHYRNPFRWIPMPTASHNICLALAIWQEANLLTHTYR